MCMYIYIYMYVCTYLAAGKEWHRDATRHVLCVEECNINPSCPVCIESRLANLHI